MRFKHIYSLNDSYIADLHRIIYFISYTLCYKVDLRIYKLIQKSTCTYFHITYALYNKANLMHM
jgi:hypothetical protein